ncbi:MAG: hypothetical protein LBV27_00520 [Oscillospiraceae bacterium]|nr:hypothetical protein [Oscillospiraceae bacterium]
MIDVSLQLDAYLYEFYEKIAENVGLPVETVLRDALFKLAGDLAQGAINES